LTRLTWSDLYISVQDDI